MREIIDIIYHLHKELQPCTKIGGHTKHIYLFGGAPCVHSWFDMREYVFSFSQYCRTQCCDRNGFLFAHKYNQQLGALV